MFGKGISINGNAGSGFQAGGLVLAVSLMLLSMLVIGCTQSQSSPEGTAPAPGQPNKTNNPQISENRTELIGDNKTAYEKTNQTIEKVIADGIYANNLTYAYPRGIDKIEASVTLSGGVVTAVSIKPIEADSISEKYISAVNAALPELVVGKKMNEISIPKQVAGSSLTTAAFKGYLAKLQSGSQ